jgi:two-component system chemotaxis response regulator CheB
MPSGSASPIKVVVVDDSAVVRRFLAQAIEAEPDLELVGIANNGSLALAVLRRERPDVVVLDVEMPVMDGLATLEPLRREFPGLPVVMFSTLTTRGGAATLEALMRGATDCVAKPQLTGGPDAALEHVRTQLIPKLRGLGARNRIPRSPAPPRRTAPPAAAPAGGTPDAVVVAVSTGGPRALDVVVPALPVLPVPMFVVQHMPPLFTGLLADRLDARAATRVVEAADHETVVPGHCYVAPGGFHLVVERDGTAVRTRLTSDPPESSCRPAADPLFRSAVAAYGSHLLAVVMTGMGADGSKGAAAVVDAGGEVIVQDEATSVVWGMPGAVVRDGLATAQVPLDGLADAIASRVRRRSPVSGGTR